MAKKLSESALVFFRKAGAKGGRARAERHTLQELSKWGKVGGWPRASRPHAASEDTVPRGPDIAVDEESFVPFVPGVRVEDFMRDLKMRGGAQTAENRAVIATAIENRKLAHCGLCGAAASAIGMFVPSKRLSAGQLCAVFYGICTECRRRSDCDWLVGARIAADDRRFGHAVELAAVSQAFPPVVELGELLHRLSPEEPLCRECALEDGRTEAKAQARDARNPQSTVRPS